MLAKWAAGARGFRSVVRVTHVSVLSKRRRGKLQITSGDNRGIVELSVSAGNHINLASPTRAHFAGTHYLDVE